MRRRDVNPRRHNDALPGLPASAASSDRAATDPADPPLAPGIAPILGGYLIDTLSWRWILYINVPIGILTYLFSIIFLEDYRTETVQVASISSASSWPEAG
jgi:hypothetical protein